MSRIHILAGATVLLAFAASFGDESGKISGFVEIPAGPVHPGCTIEDFNQRAGNARQRAIHSIEVADGAPIQLGAFRMGIYEVTNAQYKRYLDLIYRVKLTTTGTETLLALAQKHITHLGEPIDNQWKSIYALNAEVIERALKAAGNAGGKPHWDPTWPDRGQPGAGIAEIALPKGLTLEFYACVVPKHWYGWCKLSGLPEGREYVDIRLPPSEAFVPPADDPIYKRARFRAKDFKNYPVRDLAVLEAMRFADFAGCSLPTEYQFERAARGGESNAKQHPGEGKWNRRTDPKRFAWADNPECKDGPLAVDDPSVSRGDSKAGCRHLLGNVYEYTNTLWDMHPSRPPKFEPDTDWTRGNFNHALIVKGGAWGSGFSDLQISARTGMLSEQAVLDLDHLNRVASLGVRLVRHPMPGRDLIGHTIRRLARKRLGGWRPLPHEFARPRIVGVDATHFVPSNHADGYVFIRDRAIGVAVAPIWMRVLQTGSRAPQKTMKAGWKSERDDKSSFIHLGVVRIDVPFRAGVQLTDKQWSELVALRKQHAERAKQATTGKKNGRGDQPVIPPPPTPDEYERRTTGIPNINPWRERELPPGEYHLVEWYGFIGLAGSSLRMPPEAILIPDSIKSLRAIKEARSTVALDRDQIRFSFVVEEQPKRFKKAPASGDSQLWAISRADPVGWKGRIDPKKLPMQKGCRYTFTIPVRKGELGKRRWNLPE